MAQHATITIRLDHNLLTRFKAACDDEEATYSERIRQLMDAYVAQRYGDTGRLTKMLARVEPDDSERRVASS